MLRTRIFLLTAIVAALFVSDIFAPPVTPVSAYTEERTNVFTSHSPLSLYFFWSEECPHCAKEELFLETLSSENPSLRITKFEVSKNPSNQDLLKKVGQNLNVDVSGVPFTVIGEKYTVGYATDETTGKAIRDILTGYETVQYRDIVASLIQGNDPGISMSAKSAAPTPISVPFVGEVEPQNLSLPLLAIVIGALDGFNPCAMWVLLFLITLLFNVENRFRRWTLGIVFLFVSALTYFLFLSAWLHSFLFLGAKTYVTMVIGVVAIASGIFNLREYYGNRTGVCKVSEKDSHKRIFERLKGSVHENNFILALLGIALLGFLVNVVELFCSAGFPAVFTNILAMTPMPSWQYYLYLLLYIFVFMLDDLIVFIIAMKTLEMTGLSGKYTSLSHLIGGVLMLLLGVALIVRPSVLMFG